MTDEQIKAAPAAHFLMDQLMDVWAAAIPRESYAEATQNVISALQADGQYIVFAAPTGYRFGGSKALTVGSYFPSFGVVAQTITPIPGDSCAGINALVLEPLTGGGE